MSARRRTLLAPRTLVSGDARGRQLFNGRPLQHALAEAGGKERDRAISCALARREPLSKLRLRKLAVEAALHTARIVLHAPTSIEAAFREEWHEVACVVPYSGDGQLFHAGVRGAALPRPLHGSFGAGELVLRIIYDEEDERMARVLLTSELNAITDQIAAQCEVSQAYNRALPAATRAYVEKHYDGWMANRDRITAKVRAEERAETDRRIMSMVEALGYPADASGLAEALKIALPPGFS